MSRLERCFILGRLFGVCVLSRTSRLLFCHGSHVDRRDSSEFQGGHSRLLPTARPLGSLSLSSPVSGALDASSAQLALLRL